MNKKTTIAETLNFRSLQSMYLARLAMMQEKTAQRDAICGDCPDTEEAIDAFVDLQMEIEKLLGWNEGYEAMVTARREMIAYGLTIASKMVSPSQAAEIEILTNWERNHAITEKLSRLMLKWDVRS